MREEIPESREFCKKLAALHQNGVSPNGKFGFHVVTYNGNVPQENGFTETWEEFFSNGLKHMFRLNFEAGGPSQELEDLIPSLFEMVIPRLLRPLETGGNSIVPSLVHGDLWYGNAAVTVAEDAPLIFDPSSFWAHNECERDPCQQSATSLRLSYQMSWEIGAQSGICSRKATLLLIIIIYPNPRRKKIMMIGTRSTPCKYNIKLSVFLSILTYDRRFNLHAATLFPKIRSFREMSAFLLISLSV